MEYYELIRKRYSVRKYLDKKVESSKLSQILDAARVAPTGANLQPFKLIVCDNEIALNKIGKASNIYAAPLVIIVCAEIDQAWVRSYDGKNIAEIDAAIVTTHMMLEATNQGLGSVWICKFDEKVLQKEFNLPENMEVVNMLAIGYADGEPASLTRFDQQRKKLTDLIYYNKLY